jgi:hypothetical protein
MKFIHTTKTPWDQLSRLQKTEVFSGQGFRIIRILQDSKTRNPFRRYSIAILFR